MSGLHKTAHHQVGAEDFILEFSRLGTPHLVCVRYESSTGSYHHMPIPRESERAARALSSPAGVIYKALRMMADLRPYA